jgi:hypothetical protein
MNKCDPEKAKGLSGKFLKTYCINMIFFLAGKVYQESANTRIIKFSFKEGLLTKNDPIDFTQSWAIYMKKSN